MLTEQTDQKAEKHSKRLMKLVSQKQGIEKLLTVMQALRDPLGGCDWDLKQNYQSIIPFTIEEVYEVVEAIELEDFEGLKGELGDLLFQVVFYAQIAKEEGRFDFYQIVDVLCEKLIRRHPHVFSDAQFENGAQLSQAWEEQKQKERQQKSGINQSVLDDIPKSLPELKRAQKMQRRAAKKGFDWQDVSQVWDKLKEESAEVLAAAEKQDSAAIEDEIGDLLFTVVNLARHYGVDSDIALRQANQKFEQRFRQVELIADRPLTDYNQQQLEVFWQSAKKKLNQSE
ncbi:nucleoside triphosphate pyrophosphohydrolase [Aliikangiella sp. IMCC44359]|uniref:nucleoside triphosphate pyrophosphohydrolase n=1 Tax=Aliikangiella sp. IMCC44359 TaxID=3459125 RepID=UPI00403A8C65